MSDSEKLFEESQGASSDMVVDTGTQDKAPLSEDDFELYVPPVETKGNKESTSPVEFFDFNKDPRKRRRRDSKSSPRKRARKAALAETSAGSKPAPTLNSPSLRLKDKLSLADDQIIPELFDGLSMPSSPHGRNNKDEDSDHDKPNGKYSPSDSDSASPESDYDEKKEKEREKEAEQRRELAEDEGPLTQLTYAPRLNPKAKASYDATTQLIHDLMEATLFPIADKMVQVQALFVQHLCIRSRSPRITERVVDILARKRVGMDLGGFDWPIADFYSLVHEAWYVYYWTLLEIVDFEQAYPERYGPEVPMPLAQLRAGYSVDMGVLALRMERIITLTRHPGYTIVADLRINSPREHTLVDKRLNVIRDQLTGVNYQLKRLVDNLDMLCNKFEDV